MRLMVRRETRHDYVDLYQLHMDAPETTLDQTLEAFDIIVRSGKARYIGVSNMLAYRLARSIGRSQALGITRYVPAQPRYSLLSREIERELLPLAQEENLAAIPFNPLVAGLLTGKYRHNENPDKGRFSSARSVIGTTENSTRLRSCPRLQNDPGRL